MKSTPVQTISQERLDQIEYLLTQSTKGVHLLFDRDTLINTLQEPIEARDYFSFDNLNKVQTILTEMIPTTHYCRKKTLLIYTRR